MRLTILPFFFLSAMVANSLASHPMGFSDAFLRHIFTKMGNNLVDSGRDDYLDLPRSLEPAGDISIRGMEELMPPELPAEYDDLALSPSLRDREYLSHSSLLSSLLEEQQSNYQQAENNELKFRVKPTYTGLKSSDLKTDGGVLPAYCDPPNPCPIGYTEADGCLEVFENTAGFSRDYQAMHECMCDTEHMFECPDSTRDSEISALARSIQNKGVLGSTLGMIMDRLGAGSHKPVAKKFHPEKVNPYLEGDRLPVAAKKGSSY